MSNLLIVEDDENKLNEIRKFLLDEFKISEVVVARSYNSGVSEIKKDTFTFCILDMSLPSFDVDKVVGGGRRHPFGGREIIRKTIRLKSKIKFVVLTQFESFGEGNDLLFKEELESDLKEKYGTSFVELIFFSASSSEWKKDLGRILREYYIC